MYKATVQLNGNGHGTFCLSFEKKGFLTFTIYGDDPEAIRRKAAEMLEEITVHVYEREDPEFKEELERFPLALRDNLDASSASLIHSHTPYETAPTARWDINEYTLDDIIVVLQ